MSDTCPPHHWFCEPPVGGVQQGECKKCGAEREFRPKELSLNVIEWGRAPVGRPKKERSFPDFVMPERRADYVYPQTRKERKR